MARALLAKESSFGGLQAAPGYGIMSLLTRREKPKAQTADSPLGSKERKGSHNGLHQLSQGHADGPQRGGFAGNPPGGCGAGRCDVHAQRERERRQVAAFHSARGGRGAVQEPPRARPERAPGGRARRAGVRHSLTSAYTSPAHR